jgi:Ca-activated chloride channel family protein
VGDWMWHAPQWIWALGLLPVLSWARSRRLRVAWVVPYAAQWLRQQKNPWNWSAILGYLGLGSLLLALCRPQERTASQAHPRMGYDIMLVLDVSGSMQSEDYLRNGKPVSRLDAVRPVVEAFLQRRPNDRMGLVVFAGHPYTVSPLTFDHQWIGRALSRLRPGLAEDGTAIGDALGLGLLRLGADRVPPREGHSGRFIVLLTDGANNCGRMDPLAAARLCRRYGVPVYTIGAGRGTEPLTWGNRGSSGQASELDEPLLKAIAAETGGRFFRAQDSEAIESAFRAIDAHRPTVLKEIEPPVKRELFGGFAAFSLLCWMASLLFLPGRWWRAKGALAVSGASLNSSPPIPKRL